MALLATVVRRALRSVKDPSPRDVAAAELAITYAKAIDDAQVIAGPLAQAMQQVAELDRDLHDQLVKLVVVPERVAVLAQLGPKLLASMDALLITPRARAALRKGVKDAADRRSSPLDALRARRAARLDNPPPVDPSTP